MKKPARRILAAALLAAFLFWSNGSIQVTRQALTFPGLPEAFSGFRIVEMADLHGRQFGRDNRRLLAAIRRQKPDLIAIDGDLLDQSCRDWQWAVRLGEALSAIAPTVFVTGNHEWRISSLPAFLRTLEAVGVTVLDNRWLVLERDGETVLAAGVADPNGPADQPSREEVLARAWQAAPEASFCLVLSHRNDGPERWRDTGADLVLAGHGHGGVIRLPGLGGLLGRGGQWPPRYTEGVWRSGKTVMAVSRGLGNTRGTFRLLNRPHLPVWILERGES